MLSSMFFKLGKVMVNIVMIFRLGSSIINMIIDEPVDVFSDSVKVIQAFILMKKVKKTITKVHMSYNRETAIKQNCIEEENCIEEMKDKISKLEEENRMLKQQLNVSRTATYTASVKSNIEDILNTRQIHHLRKSFALSLSKYKQENNI
tara:strand:- start:1453 stop:1899 length:447 start_codon:yes stop_codon:yes gene_type:complete